MKISEFVNHLERILEEHGDLEVERTFWNCERYSASPPKIDYRAKLKGQERKARFLSSFCGAEIEERRGEKVCRIT